MTANDPLRIAGLDALDAAARMIRQSLKGVDVGGVNAVYGHASTLKVRGVDIRIDVVLRGPECRTYVPDFDGPKVDDRPAYEPSAKHMLAAHVAVAKEAYRQVSMTDVGTASWNQLLAQRAELRGTLAALLDAVEKWAR
ncbi:hypothetical protein [Yinghuangia soli]|uniref:Uncharacterized protein n=1 Tax=Yinghuangia soli TaxID=2908204 RepID=A0AA41TYS6_9ACTN|nr:hypothetical protein [Yinghuangia soli]MCF2526741.1 hypothetical protein [Yinghuangia soli]